MPRMHPASTALATVLAIVAVVVSVWWRMTPPAERAPTAARRVQGFEERAEASGLDFRMRFLPGEQGEVFKINLYDHGCGVAVGDYNGDGWDDVYFLNQLGANALFRNRGDGTFEDVTAQAGPIGLDDRICVSAAFNDYDNDGDQDLYVTSTRGGNVLLRNDGGRYTDVTDAAGVTWYGHSQTAALFDYDNDGLLDLFLTNSGAWTTEEYNGEQNYYIGVERDLEVQVKEFNVLFHNRGDGTFENVTEATGMSGRGWGGDMAVFDYDEDGRLDVLVAHMFGRSQLYRNGEDGRFHDVTDRALGATTYGAIGAKAFDHDNDGRLDLLISNMHVDMWMGTIFDYDLRLVERERKYTSAYGPYDGPEVDEDVLRDLLGPDAKNVVYGNLFFRNLGGGRFEECSDRAGLETFWPWGVATGDFDNDGYEDAFLPSGMGFPFQYWPNHLMMNEGDGTFVERGAELGIEPPVGGEFLPEKIAGKPAARSSRSAAVADFDGDGRLEIATNNFNQTPYYFRNAFPRQNYISFRLTGTRSNRDAVGALVRCHVGGQVLARQVHAAGGYLAQSSKTVHFGLGTRSEVDRVEIRWPSGLVQSIESPAVNRLWEITEPAALPP